MKYMLDTNACIFFIKKKLPKVERRLARLQAGALGISCITLAELEFGVENSSPIHRQNNREALLEFLVPLEVADFGREACRSYAKVRFNLAEKGAVIGAMDLLIAAHALSLDTILVTNNTREFGRVKGLHLEDWTRD